MHFRSFSSFTGGWAVGTQGQIAYTLNGGTEWNPIEQLSGIASTVTLYSVQVRTSARWTVHNPPPAPHV
eukprot:9071297-Pyramimonas_sp.AAC.1